MSLTNVTSSPVSPWEHVQTAPKIYKAIIAAKKEVGAVGKNATTDQRGGAKYDYRKFDDVIDAVAPLMDQYGIMIIATVLSKEERLDGNKHFVTITMGYRLIAEDGSFVEGSQVGEAFDVGDKAATKAQTVALRIFYCTTFNIPYNEMKDPESGDQHTWSNENSNAYLRLVRKLESLQDAGQMRGLLNAALRMHNNPEPNGDVLSTENLLRSIEAFTKHAKRLRFTEKVVAQIEAELRDKAAGKTATASESPELAIEPVRIKELMYDFDLAKPDKWDQMVMTTVQSFRSGHITRAELSELAAKQCPEDASRGPACFYLGAIERCGSPEELSQAVADVNAAVQQKTVAPEVGRALTNLVQTLIDGGSKANGHE
jgi:hypothetical protein